MNTLLTLAFNGGAYHGFQVQQNAVTVCAVLQDAMQRVLGARPDVKGSSRTDAGVHAAGFCVSFKHETPIPPAKLPLALNSHLPADIRVLHARRVPESFHARYSATGKEYRYTLWNSPVDSPFAHGLYYRVPGPLDVAAMQAAAAHYVGSHNFAAFASAGGKVQSTVRRVLYAGVEQRGAQITFAVAADGFLYNMVRIMAGTLLSVGQGRAAPGDIPGILAGQNRRAAGSTLPARGLCLARVFYPPAALRGAQA